MKKYATIVFETEPEKIDAIVEQFRKTFSVNIIFFKTSYDKLWVTGEPAPKEEHKHGKK
ncbi:MAG: hypothetical protein MUO82_08195 [Candidatus Thermoplasmatota archaeon]|nr:hypothetical protein [Candidatus Thermoplasmatota archaeon]